MIRSHCFPTATKAHPQPDKWTGDNLRATFDNNRVLKIIFTNDNNKIKIEE